MRQLDQLKRVGARVRAHMPVKFRITRRMIVNSALVGVVLTLLVALLDAGDGLLQLEQWLYDRRAQLCQFHTPPPTDRLVHIDIDDAALETIGAWPWRRSKFAEILDEIALAGPAAVGVDIIFPEPQEAGRDASGRAIDHDAVLADSLRRLGCALVPGSTPFERQDPPTPVQKAMADALFADIELTEPLLVALLRGKGFDAPDLAARVAQDYIRTRRETLYQRILHEFGKAGAAVPEPQLRAELLKQNPSPAAAQFEVQYGRAVNAAAMDRFLYPMPDGMPRPFQTRVDLAPVAPLSRAAAASGFVDYPPFADGKVRSVPLFVEANGKLFPQMGLALACYFLGADIGRVRYEDGNVRIPRAAGGDDVVIAVRTFESENLGRPIPMLMDIPWFGKPGPKGWESMYDPEHRLPKQHLSINTVWAICDARQRIARNAAAADTALVGVVQVLRGREAAEGYAAKPPEPHDVAARARLIDEVLEEAGPLVEHYETLKPDELTQEDRVLLGSVKALPTLRDQNARLDQEVRQFRAALAGQLRDQVVLIGWIATASIADFIPTSMHPRCPGVVLHGAIFNGIVTGEMWRTLPHWVTLSVTLVLGLVMTLAVAYQPPTRALAMAATLAAAYLLVNGLVLFDRNNLVLGAAGPTVAISTVWAGGTLIRLVTERAERARITQRFRSYVDPKLVAFVAEHPDDVKFEGQVREMTVSFTDLGNFTPLTARLGEKTVPLLNDLFGRMVPAIRQNRGLVNKFLGDGIMFFFGAPEQNPEHARDAVNAVLDLQAVLADFNRELAGRGLPEITLRAGTSTGKMVVGDAGSADASDYTVLGDVVNLGARLESANKAGGSSSLFTDRTVELAGDGFLFRPMGRLGVVGRAGVDAPMCYEVLARTHEATDFHKRLAELTTDVVGHYTAGRFADCLEALAEMEQEIGDAHGTDKFIKLYRSRCVDFLQNPPEEFKGEVVLTEK